MFGIGGQELILLMLIGLIVLGPEKLPRIANQLGSWLGQARRMTRVMKRQLEEELDFNQSPTIKPPSSAREPSQKPPTEESKEEKHTLPRDDDDYSPAHAEDEVGTGTGDDLDPDAEALAVEEAARGAPDAEPASEKEPAEKEEAS